MRWLWSAKPVAAATSDSGVPSAIIVLRPDEPTSDLEAMRRGAEGGAEVPGEREAVEAAHAFQFLRRDRARRFGHEELAGPRDAAKGDGAAGCRAAGRSPGGVGARDQAFGQSSDDGIDGQRLQSARKVGEGLVQDGRRGQDRRRRRQARRVAAHRRAPPRSRPDRHRACGRRSRRPRRHGRRVPRRDEAP